VLFHSYGRRQKHDIGFKQQREPAAIPGPGNIDHSDATLAAPDTRNIGVHVCFMLEIIQMSSGFLLCIMDCTTCLSTRRAGKAAPFGKVQMDLQTFRVNIKLTLRNLPWGGQHQRNLDEFSVFLDLKLTRTTYHFNRGYPP
jgi:hypothetical protein